MAWTRRFCSVTVWFFLPLDPDASRKSCRCGCPGPGALRALARSNCLNTFRNKSAMRWNGRSKQRDSHDRITLMHSAVFERLELLDQVENVQIVQNDQGAETKS